MCGCSRHDPTTATEAGHAGHDHSPAAADAHAGESGAKLCAEHNVPLEECGICRPEKIAQLKPGESLKVRLPSKSSAAMAGVETALPISGTVQESVDCLAEVAFNQNRLAQVAAPVGGILQEVLVDLGARVEEKQVLARVWSAAIAEAAAKAVLTHQTLDRERKLRADRVTSEKDLQEAEATHRAACQQLRTLGFTEEQVEEMRTEPQEFVLMQVRAPFAGEIVERAAVRGALAEQGKPLFTVADRSTMWITLNVPEMAVGKLEVGQAVDLQLDSLPAKKFRGTLTWIGAEVDEHTRMVRARAEVPNPEGLLRARMFGRAQVLIRSGENALSVPESSVLQVDGNSLVFVQLEDDLYEARAVQLGARYQGRYEVVEGLGTDDRMATQHGFSLKSQLLLSRMGAGCADD